jgi:hypothetical protein
MDERPPLRIAAAVCIVLFAVSFFLPTIAPVFEKERPTPGWGAFWMSLASWTEIDEWDVSAIPIVGAWLASVGALLGAAVALGLAPARRIPTWLPLALGLLSLGPLISAPRQLMVGYFVWTVATLALGVLAVVARRGAAER